MQDISLKKIQETSAQVNGKPLTLKQALFVQEYSKTGNASLSARMAYPEQTPNTARAFGSENLTKPSIQNVLLAVMDEAGLTDEYLVSKVRRGIEETEKHFDYTKLALQLRGRLQDVSVNLSHVIKETRTRYNLD